MNCLRRALAERALQQYSASCSSGVQGAAWHSTKSGGGAAASGGADGRVQRLLKALEVGEVPDVAFTEEELADGQRRYAISTCSRLQQAPPRLGRPQRQPAAGARLREPTPALLLLPARFQGGGV